MPRVRLSRGWTAQREDGDLLLFHYVSNRRFRVRAPAGAYDLLEMLRAGIGYDEPGLEAPAAAAAAGCAPGVAEAMLSQLERLDALIRDDDDLSATDQLYDRQLRFFRLFEGGDRSASMLMRRLQEATVVVVGLGGQGSWLLLLLARIGVGRLIGIDGDRVERSNLSRQVLYESSDVGQPKAVCAGRMVRAVDPRIEYLPVDAFVNEPADLLPYLRDCDVVANPFGYPSNRVLTAVDDAAWQAGVPSLVLGGSWIGPFRIDDSTPCYRCVLAVPEIRQVVDASQGDFVGGRGDEALGGPFAPRMAATSSVAATEIALHLSGARRPRSAEGVVVLDLFDFDRTRVRVVDRSPACRCTGGPAPAGGGRRP
jgi:hypothetical protein